MTKEDKYDERGHKITTHEGYTGYIHPDIKEYFLEQYKQAPFRVVPGHWPSMETKEDVDNWIRDMSDISNIRHLIEQEKKFE